MENLLSSLMNSQTTNKSTTTNPSPAAVNNLLSKQMTTTDSINNLINTASQLVLCGPGSECEKQQVSVELNRRLQEAEVNEKVAPLRLANAKRHFYTYTKGQHYYDDVLEKELQEKSSLITGQIADKFNEEIQNANTMNMFFNTSQLNSENTIELYEEYLKKNAEMAEIIKSSRGDVLTNDRKTYYETEAIGKLKMWYTLTMTIYWILLVAFIVSIFVSPSPLSQTKRIVIAILLILYPFTIHKIVVYLYNFFSTTIKNTETNIYMDL
jgi:hypothetical protein